MTAQASPIKSPITDAAYDIISTLHTKLEGIQTYSKYAKDGNSQIWQQLAQSDMQAVNTLCQQLEQMVQNGQFRNK